METKQVNPILVVAGEPQAGDALVRALRELRRVTVALDSPKTALEMMQAIDVALIIVDVSTASDWRGSEMLARAAACPVAVVTAFLARDRRFRNRAFDSGVAGYLCKPWTPARLHDMVRRLEAGHRDIEILGSAVFFD